MIAIAACQQSDKNDAEDSQYDTLKHFDFPSSWTMLTQREGKLVVFNPCDANNPVIEIRQDTLYINFGQEEGFYNITSILKNDHDKVILVAKPDFGDNPDKFKVEFLDKERKQARWFIWSNDSTAETFTDTRFVNEYANIKQPCRECWGEDVCAEADTATVAVQ
jgi:hypothetical protein